MDNKEKSLTNVLIALKSRPFVHFVSIMTNMLLMLFVIRVLSKYNEIGLNDMVMSFSFMLHTGFLMLVGGILLLASPILIVEMFTSMRWKIKNKFLKRNSVYNIFFIIGIVFFVLSFIIALFSIILEVFI